jgi:anthranilate synthase component 1
VVGTSGGRVARGGTGISARPGEAEFLEAARAGNVVPVVAEVLGDLETPISLYRKLAPLGAVYLLESAEGGERFGRYSFVGVGPLLSLVADEGGVRASGPLADLAGWLRAPLPPSPLAALRAVMGRLRPAVPAGVRLPRFWGGAVGYFAYELIHHLERLPRQQPGPHPWPVAAFVLTELVVIVDHLTHRLQVVAPAVVDGEPREAYRRACRRIDEAVAALRGPAPEVGPGPGTGGGSLRPADGADGQPRESRSVTRAEFEAMVRAAQRYIRAGDIFQVVLSQRFQRPLGAAPFDVYRALRSLNPSPYMFFLDWGDHALAGASPEMLVRVEDGVVQTRPIAGTRPRGRTEQEDRALAAELLADPKERAEHVMLVDLGRNDVGRVAEPGSVSVPELMAVERYSHVMHIVSSVTGRLRGDADAFDALGACFPAGTLTGAPKVRAMEIIAELERERRGPYGGAVGYFAFTGNMDTCITIRTVAMAGGRAYVQAGAGVVADSEPGREYEETEHKARAVLRALELAEEGVL